MPRPEKYVIGVDHDTPPGRTLDGVEAADRVVAADRAEAADRVEAADRAVAA